LQQHRFGLAQVAVEAALDHHFRQLAQAAAEGYGESEAGRDDAVSQQHISLAEPIQVVKTPEKYGPDREEGQVVQEHEPSLHQERSAQGKRGTQVGAQQ
jgi:hypothetical protein